MPPRLRIGPFRGLAPYLEEDADLFFGRDRERTALREVVTGEEDTTVLLVGETGAGKTSLLRAGLIPSLTGEWIAFYLECSPTWRRTLTNVLSRKLQRTVQLDDPLGDPLEELLASGTARPLVILDHLEQLLWLEAPVEGLPGLLSKILARGGKLVAAVDRGNVHAVEQLAAKVPEVAGAVRVQVERIDRATAAMVMEQTVLAGGGYMEAGLPELIAEELTAEGPVLPAALQTVGHAVLLQGATSVRRYSRSGGAKALANLHVERLVARAGGWQARRVLATLSEHPNPRASFVLSSITQSCGLHPEVTRTVLGALVEQGVVELQEDATSIRREPRYAIIHPYLLQSIRDTVAPVHRGRAQARLSLRRRIHGGGVLRPDEILRVWRYLGEAISGPEREQVRRGTKVWAGVLAGVLALPLVVSLVIWAVLAASSYVDTAPGLPGLQRVVVRSGKPSLDFAFNMTPTAYGEVKLDTGLLFASLPRELRGRVLDNAIEGPRAKTSPYWLRDLLAPLPPVRRGALQILAGEVAAGSKLLQDAAASEAERERATRALALLSGDTPETQAALNLCMRDARPEVRRMAVREARRLAFTRAREVLTVAVRDRDNNIRLAALEALRSFSPAAVIGLLGASLGDSDPRVQREALKQLTLAARTRPVEVYDVIRRALARPERYALVAAELRRLLNKIQGAAPRKVSQHLLSLAKGAKSTRTRVEALERLAGMPGQLLRADKVLPAVTRLSGHPEARLRAAAITLQARFGEPGQVMTELTKLAHMTTPKDEAALMRRAAAAGLGLVGGRPDQDRVKLLRRLRQDPDPATRTAAMESLVKLGAPGLRQVVRGIMEGAKDVAQAALDAVCRDERPDRRVATTVLAASWRVKRIDLRGQALRCARSLVAANPRLSLWLASMARLDKKPEVKRAAAEAVALAMSQGGKRAEQLLQIYLRQGDGTIIAAVLTAMSTTPPRATPTLFGKILKLVPHKDPKVRAATAPLLVMTAPRPPQAVAALEQLLRDPDPQVVQAALDAASRLEVGKDTARLDPIIAQVVAAARSKEALAALKVARKLGLERPVQRATMHPGPEVRAAAVELLARDPSRDKTLSVLEAAQLDPELAIRLAALRALAKQSERLGEPAVRLLHRSLDAAAPGERWAAFEALGRVRGQGAAKAVELLRQLGRDRSEERRRLAMRSLGALAGHSRAAVAALLEGAQDPALDVRTEAQAFLARFLGRHCPHGVLWELLVGSERDALRRHLALSALAWSGRYHGTEKLKAAVKSVVAEKRAPIVNKMAARLALALARRNDRPEEVIGWLYGW